MLHQLICILIVLGIIILLIGIIIFANSEEQGVKILNIVAIFIGLFVLLTFFILRYAETYNAKQVGISSNTIDNVMTATEYTYDDIATYLTISVKNSVELKDAIKILLPRLSDEEIEALIDDQ
jgi:hypothetical protein